MAFNARVATYCNRQVTGSLQVDAGSLIVSEMANSNLTNVSSSISTRLTTEESNIDSYLKMKPINCHFNMIELFAQLNKSYEGFTVTRRLYEGFTVTLIN